MKILRKILGLNKLLKARGELKESIIFLKQDISELQDIEQRERHEQSRRWNEAQEHRDTIERLKKDKEEIIESLANIDGFRGIKTLLNNMIQPALTKEK